MEIEELLEEKIAKFQNIENLSGYDSTQSSFDQGESAGSSRVAFEAINDLKELKQLLPLERKPVVVDSFIAEWYEPRKYNILSYLLELATKEKDPVFSKWYRSCEGKHNNLMANADELLAEMHIHGYTAKKEPTVHHLKIGLTYFKAVRDGCKTFEIRKNDRDYKVGDILVLQEYTCGSYTDDECVVKVTYITDYEQKEGYVVLGIVSVEEEAE